jgi:hypothetical protein
MCFVERVERKEKMIAWLHALLASIQLSELLVEKNAPVLVARLTRIANAGDEEVIKLSAERTKNCEEPMNDSRTAHMPSTHPSHV